EDAAGGTAADLPPPVAELVRGGLQRMIAVKKKTALALLLAAGLAGTAGYAVYRSLPASAEASWAQGLPAEVVASPETAALSGKVLTPDGRPAAGADLYLVTLHPSVWDNAPRLGVTNDDGTFACPVPKGGLARHLVVERPVHLVAAAPGFGLAWHPVFDFLPEAERSRAGLLQRLTAPRRD